MSTDSPHQGRRGRRRSTASLAARQNRILEMARDRGYVSIEALSKFFSVTTQTIRRDINKLCDNGQLQRYHGGAGPVSSVENLAYAARQSLHLTEKKRIAQLAAAQIPDKASLLINLGTTTEEVARALLDHQGLRIITNNLNVALILSSKDDFEIIVAGGVVRNRDRGVIGESAIDFIKQFKVDYGIIGTSGIDADGTLLDYDYREIRVARTIIANSRQIFLVTDYSKFSRTPMVRLGHISEVDVLFTDRQPPRAFVDILEEGDTRLVVPA